MRTCCRIGGFLLASAAAAAVSAGEHVTVFEAGQEGYNVYRIPAVIRAGNGDLLAFCEAREAGDASPIDLVMKRSADGGRHWGPLTIVQAKESFQALFGDEPPPITVGNPAPVVDRRDPDRPGRIWLPFTVENDRVFVVFSDDHGATWSTRKEITDSVKRPGWGWYATGPVHSIQIRRGPWAGRLVIPCDHRLGGGGQDRGELGAHVVFSHDHGQTWQLGAVDDTYDDGLNANETTVVELNDGRLYFNTRDQNGPAPGTRGQAWSSDGGTRFDPLSPPYRQFAPVNAVLDPPVVQCCVLRAASRLDGHDADVILFSGPDESGPTGAGRSDLRIRYSTDETATWRDGPLLHTGPAAYSDMVSLETDDQQFGILFECGEPGGSAYERIAFEIFTLSDVLQHP